VSETDELTPEEREHYERILMLNAVRLKAYKNIFFAVLSLAAVGAVYLATQSLVWTGGILLAGSWLWNSYRTFRVTSAQLGSYEILANMSLKEPVPTALKLGIVIGVPAALILGVSALGSYDPSLVPWGQAQPTIVEMYVPSDSENVNNYSHYSGVVLDIPSECSALTISGKIEDSAKNEIGSYVNEFDSTQISATTSAHLVVGTNESIPDGSYITVNEALCH